MRGSFCGNPRFADGVSEKLVVFATNKGTGNNKQFF